MCQCGEGDLRVRQDQPTDGEQANGQENLSTNRTGTPWWYVVNQAPGLCKGCWSK